MEKHVVGDHLSSEVNRAANADSTEKIMLCAACRPLMYCNFGLKDERLIELGVTHTRLVCPRTYEGGQGIAHGGWIAGVLDEVLGHLPFLCGVMVVAAKLEVDFLRPVPIERLLEAHAWRERQEGRRWFTKVELILVSTGAVLARGQGVFVERDAAYFERHQKWLREQDQIAAGNLDSDPADRQP
jgi:acyl-coenzyme A thioesterase PaaI-like protein